MAVAEVNSEHQPTKNETTKFVKSNIANLSEVDDTVPVESTSVVRCPCIEQYTIAYHALPYHDTFLLPQYNRQHWLRAIRLLSQDTFRNK